MFVLSLYQPQSSAKLGKEQTVKRNLSQPFGKIGELCQSISPVFALVVEVVVVERFNSLFITRLQERLPIRACTTLQQYVPRSTPVPNRLVRSTSGKREPEVVSEKNFPARVGDRFRCELLGDFVSFRFIARHSPWIVLL